MASPAYITSYYQKLRQWDTAVNLEHLWRVFVNFPSSLAGAQGLISSYEGDASTSENTPYGKISGESDRTETGCFYARTVTIPSETALVENGASNGYLNPLISKGRGMPEAVRIGFLETNVSIESVIRPWIKLVGMYGLVARKDMNLHGNIIVSLLTQAKGGSSLVPRRELIFENVVILNKLLLQILY
jgi:hypothetical protein